MVKTAVTMLLLIGGLIVFVAQTAPASGVVCVKPSASITGVGRIGSSVCAPIDPFSGGTLEPYDCREVIVDNTRAKECVSVKIHMPF